MVREIVPHQQHAQPRQAGRQRDLDLESLPPIDMCHWMSLIADMDIQKRIDAR